MPCRDALIAAAVTLAENSTFAEALEIFDRHGIRCAPVVDQHGKYLGMFSLRSTFIALLPVAATMEDGLENLDFAIGVFPGIAKKLKKISPTGIARYIERGTESAHPDMALLEAMRLIVRQGSPLPVVNRETGQFVGLVSEQSILTTCRRLLETMDHQPKDLSPEDRALLKEFGVIG